MATSVPAASTPNSKWHKHVHSFDIDNYLNCLVPRPRFYLLPRFISHWFGYRSPNVKPQPPPSNPIIWLSACLGGFIGIAIISAVYHALPMLGGEQVPIIIASFGAAAVLEYNTIESPLSQPRNLIIGHVLSALIGVSITKGFARLPEQRFEDLRWLSGAVSVGVASLVMGVTKTVHPPAGATALLASTSPDITILGWWLIPLVLLAAVLMAVSALLVNNLTRRWPVFWWTPVDLSRKSSDVKHVSDIEKQQKTQGTSILSDSTTNSTLNEGGHLHDEDFHSDNASTLDNNRQNPFVVDRELQIVITPHEIILPDWMEANDWETEILEIFRQNLQRRSQSEGQN